MKKMLMGIAGLMTLAACAVAASPTPLGERQAPEVAVEQALHLLPGRVPVWRAVADAYSSEMVNSPSKRTNS